MSKGKMSKDTKGALIVIGVAVIITVGIFFMTRGRGAKETGGEAEIEISKKQEEVKKEEFVEILSDGSKLNKSETLQKAKTYEGMEMKDFQLTENGNTTLLLGTITNNTGEERGGQLVDLVMIDKEGRELERAALYIKKLQPGESTQLSSYVQGDIANAYDFNIAERGEKAVKE